MAAKKKTVKKKRVNLRKLQVGASSGKGSSFERKVCVMLSLWISDGLNKDVFWRSASSGARSTLAVRRGEAAKQFHSSDIAPVDKAAYLLLDKFTIECKHYQSLQLEGLAYPGNCKMEQFWKQATRDAEQVNKRPLLIARQNGRPILLGMRLDDFEWFQYLYLKSRVFPRPLLSIRRNLALVDLKSFLDAVDPSVLENYN